MNGLSRIGILPPSVKTVKSDYPAEIVLKLPLFYSKKAQRPTQNWNQKENKRR